MEEVCGWGNKYRVRRLRHVGEAEAEAGVNERVDMCIRTCSGRENETREEGLQGIRIGLG